MSSDVMIPRFSDCGVLATTSAAGDDRRGEIKSTLRPETGETCGVAGEGASVDVGDGDSSPRRKYADDTIAESKRERASVGSVRLGLGQRVGWSLVGMSATLRCIAPAAADISYEEAGMR